MLEYHIFSGASQLAYGAVAFIKTSLDGGVSCSFLIGKAKVVPIRQLSNPQIELQTATLGTQPAQFFKSRKNINFAETVF